MLCVCRSCCHYRQTTASPWDPAGEKRRASLSSVSSMTSSEFDPAQHPLPKRSVKKEFEARRKHPVWEKTPYKKRRSRTRSHSTHKRYDKRSRSRSHSPSRGYDKHRGRSSLHPWQRSDYIRSRNDSSVDYNKQKSDKLEEFKRLSNAIENDMERIFKQHEKNPEKHPQYNEEWKQFWNRRYKELQAEGKDATNYDFKPEWIEFWNKRMLELHSTDIKTKKDALRKRLGLPEEPNPISFKITGGRKKSSHKEDSKDSKPVPLASVPDQDPDIIIIEDKDEDTISSKRSHSPWESEPGSRPNSRRSRERSRKISRDKSKERVLASRDRSRERSHRSHDRSRSRSRDRWHPRSREKEYHRDLPPHEKAYYRDVHRKHAVPEYLKPPRAMRDVTRHPVLSPPLRKPELPEPELDDEEVNIVGVLRLLTALEEKLGSLGPKIIDLLGKALAMEKSEANSSETLIDNEVNCVLFETVKEKLKGQLLAGLVDYNQEKAFKKAIKKIASLIHFASERKKEKEKEKQVDPIKVPGVGTVDKAAIAKQIATALVLQGKTDVSQAELEQLINAVVSINGDISPNHSSHGEGSPLRTSLNLKLRSPVPTLQCPMCKYTSVSPEELEEHINRQHFDLTSPSVGGCTGEVFSCPLCVKTFDSAPDLELHVNIEHRDILSPASPSTTTCPVCGVMLDNDNDSEEAARHVESHFPAGSPLQVDKATLREREQREFELLRAQYGMDNQGNFREQSVTNMQRAVYAGEMSVSDYYERTLDLRAAESCGIDDGSSVTRTLVPRVRAISSNSQNVVRILTCTCVDHYASSYGDRGWGCGYRNAQMVISSLLTHTGYNERLYKLWQGQKPPRSAVPSISRLQSLIEQAWSQGFDVQGSEQLGCRLVNTRKWIGATEVVTLLSFLRIRCQLVDFHRPTGAGGAHPELFNWVLKYFENSLGGEFTAPLYLQHQGHSRTIMGVEVHRDGTIILLVLDPSHSPSQMGQLMDTSSGSSAMRLLRKSEAAMKARQYQIVAVVGMIDSEQQYQQSKILRGLRIPQDR